MSKEAKDYCLGLIEGLIMFLILAVAGFCFMGCSSLREPKAAKTFEVYGKSKVEHVSFEAEEGEGSFEVGASYKVQY